MKPVQTMTFPEDLEASDKKSRKDIFCLFVSQFDFVAVKFIDSNH